MRPNNMGSSSGHSKREDISEEEFRRAGYDEEFRNELLAWVKKKNPYPRGYNVYDGEQGIYSLGATLALLAIRHEQFKVIWEKPEEEQMRIFAQLLSSEGVEKIVTAMKEEKELHIQRMKEAENDPEKLEKCRKMRLRYRNHIRGIFCDYIGD